MEVVVSAEVKSGRTRKKHFTFFYITLILIICFIPNFAQAACLPSNYCPGIEYTGHPYPKLTTGWTTEVQGVAHDQDYWYFTVKYAILKIPVGFDLATSFDFDSVPDRIKVQFMDQELKDMGYEYFGDLDQAGGFLFVPVTGFGTYDARKHPAIAVYRASDLSPVGVKYTDQDTVDWVAFNWCDYHLYSSKSTIDSAHGLYSYNIDFASLASPSPDMDKSITLAFSSEDPNSLHLFEKDGGAFESHSSGQTCGGRPCLAPPILGTHIQGGIFTPTGDLFIINGNSRSDPEVVRGGIHLFGKNGRLIAESTNGNGCFNYEYHTGLGGGYEEPEGIDWWNLDSTGSQAPNIGGQLHAILLVNNIDNADTLDFKHYIVDYSCLQDTDSDGDGISNQVEIYNYGTCPWVADTDRDGFSDGEEIMMNSDPKNPLSTPHIIPSVCVNDCPPEPDFIITSLTCGVSPFPVTLVDKSKNGPTWWCWTFTNSANHVSTYDGPFTSPKESYTYNLTETTCIRLTEGNSFGSKTSISKCVKVCDEGIDPLVCCPPQLPPVENKLWFLPDFGGIQRWFKQIGDSITHWASPQTGSTFIPATSQPTSTPPLTIVPITNRVTIVPSALTSSFIATPSSGTVPLKVTVDASGSKSGNSPITSYAWDFGDGMSGTGTSGSHTYSSAGQYTIRLIVKDSAGLTDSTYQQIVVSSTTKRDSGAKAPEAQFVVTPSSGTAPLSVKLDASGSHDPDGTIITYSWDFGDGMTGTGPSGSHTYTSAGTYTIRLTVQDNSGLSGSATRQVTVTRGTTAVPITTITTAPQLANQPPIAAISAYPLSGPVPLEVNFYMKGSGDPDGTIVSYAWDFGDGQTGSGTAVSHVYGAAGIYTATLTVTDNQGATAKATKQVVVTGGVVADKYLVKTAT